MKQKIFIIIPTHNRPLFVENALKSVLNQTYQNIFILISDNGTNLDTFNVVKSYLSTNVIYRKTGNGLSSTEHANIIKNILLEFNSFYDFYSMLHDDDEMLPDHIQSSIDLLNTNSVGLVSSPALLMDEHGNSTEKIFLSLNPASDIIIKGGFGLLRRCTYNPLCCPSIVYRKNVSFHNNFTDAAGYIDYSSNIYNIYLYGALVKMTPTFKYRIHSNNDSLKFSCNTKHYKKIARSLAINALQINTLHKLLFILSFNILDLIFPLYLKIIKSLHRK